MKPLPKAPKAYKNAEFLNSPQARALRMLAEFAEPQSRFYKENIKDTIVFFGSARIKPKKESVENERKVRSRLARVRRPTKEMIRELRKAQVQVEMSGYYEDCVALARMITSWSKNLDTKRRFVICSGGGPGIMEAANKGAYLAGGKSIGLNISLPFEQFANPYISPELNFEFHYFFMRKFWFMYLAKALVVFPGGFGTLDELMEVLTLMQTDKVKKKMTVVMYGSQYWRKVFNFQEMVSSGVIDGEDLKLFKMCDTPEEAFKHLKKSLTRNYLS